MRAIQFSRNILVMRRERMFYVCIMASKPWGTLYVGVTNNIMQRVCQHREETNNGFTKRYAVKLLVYFEEHATVGAAIHREKRIKKWPRAWKINLIRTNNPDWNDLAKNWYPKLPTKAELENWIARTSRAMTEEG